MATEKEANIAREKFSTELKDLGVHAVAVDQISHEGKKTFAVIAFVEKENKNLPDTLEITVNNKAMKVPLLTKLSGKFKAE